MTHCNYVIFWLILLCVLLFLHVTCCPFLVSARLTEVCNFSSVYCFSPGFLMQMSPSNVATFWFLTCFFFVRLYHWNMYNLWQKYIYQHLKRKSKFWMMRNRLWDDLWPHPTTVFSLSGKKKKAWFQGNKMDKMGLQITLLRSVHTTTSWIKVTGWSCSGCRTPTGWVEADSLFTSLMLGAQTRAPDALVPWFPTFFPWSPPCLCPRQATSQPPPLPQPAYTKRITWLITDIY